MISKKSKFLISLAICGVFVFGLTSCTNTSKVENKIVYTFSQNVEDVEILKMSNEPMSNFWFPEDLLNWDPSKDENINFNKATIPLAKRVSKDKLKTVNKTQNKDFNIVALSMMNASTSGNSSQGSNKFDSNTFSYWQYIDKLVYWGGSSGEGIIVPPTADVINSAHKNGVPVLGTIFFPTTEHGGKAEWVDQFLQKNENGEFPMVKKLIEVCNTLGFDGWFINQETGLTVKENDFIDQKETAKEGAKITEEHAVLMQEFIKQFKEKSDLEVMWYDSLTKDGKMDWQNALTDQNDYFLIDENKNKVADTMFLNFWWTTSRLADQDLLKVSKNKAHELGLNPYDLFAGIDMQENGTSTKIRWNLFEDENKNPYTSLGLYCPSWTFFSSKSVDEFMSKEERLWVNELGDPTKEINLGENDFRGMSTYAVEKTVLNSLPFVTNFNMGNGYNYFVNGEKVSSSHWNNRSLADVMPTYRWIIDNGNNNNLKASIDYSNAYYGGNSIKLFGDLKAGSPSTIKLFSSDLKIEENLDFTTTVMSSNNVSLNLILEFDDGSIGEIVGDKKVSNDWTSVKFDLSKFVGKVISSISYKITSDEDASSFKFNFGNMKILGKEKLNVPDVKNLKVDDAVFEDDNTYAGVRLSFESLNMDNINNFEIYKVNEDGSRTFLGATINQSFFVNGLLRDEKYNTTTFEVVALNKDMTRSKGATVKMDWPSNAIPRANFSASRTLVPVGETITFKNLSSKATKNVEWTFEGADVEKSTDENPTVKYSKEGVYNVTLKAKGDEGEDIKIMEGHITVTNDAKDNFKNISLGKSSEASSFVNSSEAPQFAFDGKLDTKWCATGNPPHNITVDLGKSYMIGEVRMAHAEAGNESPSMNTSDYTIEISEDGVNFTEIVNVKNNSLPNTVDTFKATSARYVRVNAIKPTQGSDSAVRIYEIEVFGIDK